MTGPLSAVTALLWITEVVAAGVFLRWFLSETDRRTKTAWALLLLTSFGAFALLSWQFVFAERDWQVMVSPGGPSLTPQGRRTFSTPFWLASWGLLIIPWLALQQLISAQKPAPLIQFRTALFYSAAHLVSVGMLLR